MSQLSFYICGCHVVQPLPLPTWGVQSIINMTSVAVMVHVLRRETLSVRSSKNTGDRLASAAW
jgi:hypothetical protein